ncbi:hypothetical protein [Achromobacter deleyi]|uniref:hypothetical protein n=1 Tax=Achromobacter deleyi TaxID=1353891 RepID=UPI0014931D6C|nr:hypothetical protein [Achromobacter deleyi]QVQ26987.1 hypothetical protein HLG70_00540 [Achromobacter deleyi]UIP22566.1 hypothetical protein LYZ39_08640 [Achromobacter deleyi]
MKPYVFGLAALFGLGALTGNIAQAQYNLTAEDRKSLQSSQNNPARNGRPQGGEPARLSSSARDADFSKKFNQSLADTERKRQAEQEQSTRTQLHQREMFNANAPPADRTPGAQNDRTEMQVGEYGAAYCRKSDTGQVSCGAQGYR